MNKIDSMIVKTPEVGATLAPLEEFQRKILKFSVITALR